MKVRTSIAAAGAAALLGGTGAVLIPAVASAHSSGSSTPLSSGSSHPSLVHTGTWGNAIEVPGTANIGGSAAVSSVSCPSAGNCSAGGQYAHFSGQVVVEQDFVVTETNGVWGQAFEVPGIAALRNGRSAGVESLSCASAGNCSAGGYYMDSSSTFQAFVATETNGTWGKAIKVPGTAALNTGGNAHVTAMSCASAGNCSAGGTYRVPPNSIQLESPFQAFVVTETNGVWGKAIEVPGSAALNAGVSAGVSSVSCASAGNCSAGGTYTDSSGDSQAFVVNQK